MFREMMNRLAYVLKSFALADVLFGEYNPAGRLVRTWPSFAGQLPPMMGYDIRRGRRLVGGRAARP